MKSIITSRGLFRTTIALAFVASTVSGSIAGAASEETTWSRLKANGHARSDKSGAQANGKLTDAVNATRGQLLFTAAQANAALALTLSELVKLTPYITGEKTAENSTLSELAAITPIVVKFQEAFKAEIARLSLGEIVQVTRYMKEMEMNRFPYPELEGPGEKGTIAS